MTPFRKAARAYADTQSARIDARVANLKAMNKHSTLDMPKTAPIDSALDASDLWLVPRTGRVVFDDRGNSTWQWPGQGDPFAAHSSLEAMNAADLRIVEPTEIRRSKLPWTHDSERPAREYTNETARSRRMR